VHVLNHDKPERSFFSHRKGKYDQYDTSYEYDGFLQTYLTLGQDIFIYQTVATCHC
jgi:hypothetical protein